MKKFTSWFKRMGNLMALVMLVAMGLPAALSADAQVDRKDAGLQSFPVEATTQIYKGAMVCLNAAGYLVAGADTAGYKFVGIAYENILGTTQGAKSCRVYTLGRFLMTATSITQAMVGNTLYLVDDATVDDVTVTNFVAVGKLVQYVSSTSGWVDIGQQGEFSTRKSVSLNGVEYATITLAMAAAAANDIILLGPGTYTEDVTWSSANNVTLQALLPGTVTVTAVTAFAVSVNPAAATSTWTFTIRDITLSHGTGLVGLLINNTNVTKRINAMLDNVDIESQTATDAAIDVNRGGTSAHAIRIYATGHGNTIEGLVDYITESTDDRVRFWGYRLIGGITITGAIVMEVTFVNCGIKTSGETYGTGNVSNHFGCYNETDANPNVHTVVADDDETSH
jgi:hypothetical protein